MNLNILSQQSKKDEVWHKKETQQPATVDELVRAGILK